MTVVFSTVRAQFASKAKTGAVLRACQMFTPGSARAFHQTSLRFDPNPMPGSPKLSNNEGKAEADTPGASSNSQDMQWQMFHTSKRLDDEVAVVDQRIHSLNTKTNDVTRGLRKQLNSWIRCGIGAGVATFCLIFYTSDKNLSELKELEERLDRKHTALDIRIGHLEGQHHKTQNQLRIE